jgi:SAM-dependent methyltransferase
MNGEHPLNGDALTIVERERRFHNNRYSVEVNPRAHLDKWYGAVWHGIELQKQMVRTYARDKDVLEYGCSDGAFSLITLKLPEICRSMTGIDISDVAIDKANARAAALGYGNASFRQMNAEAMRFPDESFDLVWGVAIIHHLDLDKSFSEVARVLRPGGVAVFSEPMGHNPVLNLYRKRTPEIRTPDEHPLRTEDFALARRYFSRVDTVFYGMFTVLSVMLGAHGGSRPWRVARAIDDVILRPPLIGRYAWSCLCICHKG